MKSIASASLLVALSMVPIVSAETVGSHPLDFPALAAATAVADGGRILLLGANVAGTPIQQVLELNRTTLTVRALNATLPEHFIPAAAARTDSGFAVVGQFCDPSCFWQLLQLSQDFHHIEAREITGEWRHVISDGAQFILLSPPSGHMLYVGTLSYTGGGVVREGISYPYPYDANLLETAFATNGLVFLPFSYRCSPMPTADCSVPASYPRRAVNEVNLQNGTVTQWVTELPVVHSHGALVAVGDRFYAFGAVFRGDLAPYILSYDIQARDVRTLGVMLPRLVVDPAIAVQEEVAYLVGGLDEAGALLEGVLTFSLENQPPVAHAQYRRIGSVVIADGLTSHDADGFLAWHWDWGDGNRSTGIQAVHRYTDPGEYEIRLTVIDDDSAEGYLNTTVTIPPLHGIPPVLFQRDGATLYVRGLLQPKSLQYLIDWGDGTATAGSEATHHYLIPGNYTVQVFAVESDMQFVLGSMSFQALSSGPAYSDGREANEESASEENAPMSGASQVGVTTTGGGDSSPSPQRSGRDIPAASAMSILLCVALAVAAAPRDREKSA